MERIAGLPRVLRAVAYHGTPLRAKDAFARQLDFYARHYRSLGEAGAERFVDRQPAEDVLSKKTPLIISFDDGLLSNYEVAAPLLEERGLVGWFFVPTELIGQPASVQSAYCGAHEISVDFQDRGGLSNRIAMSWAELSDLSRRGHTIGCHTATHRRMRGEIPETVVADEIVRAARMLQERIGHTAASFAWVGGEPDTYSRLVFDALPRAGFKFAFTTQSGLFRLGDDPLLIHRTVLDADMSYLKFRLKLAGLSDLLHTGRRARLERAMKQ